jgi:pre-mRNA-processing factor 40
LQTLACKPTTTRRRAYWEEQVGKAKQREEEEEARRKRAKDRFTSLLRHARNLDASTTWEEFTADYEREKEFKEVGRVTKRGT